MKAGFGTLSYTSHLPFLLFVEEVIDDLLSSSIIDLFVVPSHLY